jgi:hypothetical protein
MGLLLKMHILQAVPEKAGDFSARGSQETVCGERGISGSIRRRTAKEDWAYPLNGMLTSGSALERAASYFAFGTFVGI